MINLRYGEYHMKIENGQHLVSKDGINFVDLSDIEQLDNVDIEVDTTTNSPLNMSVDANGNRVLSMDRTCPEHALPDVLDLSAGLEEDDDIDIDELLNSIDI